MISLDKAQEKQLKIQKIKDIPPLPLVGQRLLMALNDEDVAVDEVAGIIVQDPALAARILGLANSAFFGSFGNIKTIKQAIIKVLGFDLVKSLAFSMVMSGVFDAKRCKGFELDRYWSSAMVTAVLAGLLGQYVKIDGRFRKQHFYLCGLLHNLGILVLVHAVPEEMSGVFTALQSDEGKDLTYWERKLLGTDHHSAGGWLARKWQLPAEVVAVIEHHHDLTFRSPHWELPLLIGYCKEWARRWMADVSEPPEVPMVTDSLGITPEDLQRVRSRFQTRFVEIKQVAQQIGL